MKAIIVDNTVYIANDDELEEAKAHIKDKYTDEFNGEIIEPEISVATVWNWREA